MEKSFLISAKFLRITAIACLLSFLPACGGGSPGSSSSPSNPIPVINSISPSTATRGGPAFTLTVNGSNFVSGTVVRWNGNDRPTTFVNSGQVNAEIPADDIVVGGKTENVTIFNPPPGGGTSNSHTFNIPCVLASPTPASSQKRALLGADYFDGWAGEYDSYTLRELVNSPFQDRQPLSGWRDDNQCSVEQQLAWARSFGLDFFLFDWFPQSLITPGENLNYGLETIHSLADRHGMQYAIQVTSSGGDPNYNGPPNWTTHVNEWIGYMTDPAYLRVNGKPFIGFFEMKDMRQVFGSSSAVAGALNQLRAAAQAKGLPGVYIAGQTGSERASAGQDGLFPDLSMMLADGYDAVYLAYSGAWLQGMTAGEQNFSILSDGGRWAWAEGELKSPLPFIPVVIDGWDPRPCAAAQDPGCPWDPQTITWVNRTPQELTVFLADALTWAESNPQVRVEPSPNPPLVLLSSWNELTEGHYILPTIGDGTSYGDSLAEMLATPPSKVRSIITLSDSGSSDPNRAATGTLTDAAGLPIGGANIAVREIPVNGSYAQYQLSGVAPGEAAQAVVGFRVNIQDPWPGFFNAGPRPSDFSLYQVRYVQPSDGIQRVTNSDFSAGAQSWTLQVQTQITASDRGAGQMVRVVAGSSQSAWLDSAPFDVTGGASFQLTFSARITPSSLGSGYFLLYFLDANGGGPLPIPGPGDGHLTAETIPLAPAHVAIGTTTTDASGQYQLSIRSLGTAQVSLEAAYSGDTQHWPAYAKVGR